MITFLATRERIQPIAKEKTNVKKDLKDIGDNIKGSMNDLTDDLKKFKDDID